MAHQIDVILSSQLIQVKLLISGKLLYTHLAFE